jgi:hypothetical protein
MTHTIQGYLEIDSQRGVIYFHSVRTGITNLRICRLPTPIPEETELDITHMHGTNWGNGPEKMMPGSPPYTDAERKQRASLIRDAATSDPGKRGEINGACPIELRSFDYTDEELNAIVRAYVHRPEGPLTLNESARCCRLAAQLLDTRILVRKAIQKLKDLCS